jgi:ELWxxDGT repeat protein
MRQVWRLVAVAVLLVACGCDAGGETIEDVVVTDMSDAASDQERADMLDAAPDQDRADMLDAAPDLPDDGTLIDCELPEPEPEPVVMVPPLPSLAGAARVQLDQTYPLPGAHTLSCRAEVAGASDVERIWRRDGQEVGRGEQLAVTLGVGEAVTCEAWSGGAMVASATARAARMGQVADLARQPAPLHINDPDWARGERHEDRDGALGFVTGGALWRTDGSSIGTRRLAASVDFYPLRRVFDDLYEEEWSYDGPGMLRRIDEPSGPLALDLRGEQVRGSVRAVMPCLDGERCALVQRMNSHSFADGVSLWRLARAGQPQQQLWSRDLYHGEGRVVEQGVHRAIVAAGHDATYVVRVGASVEEHVIEGARRPDVLTSAQIGAGACLVVEEGGVLSLRRVDAATGQAVPLVTAGFGYPAALIEAGEGCVALLRGEQGASLLWADAHSARTVDVAFTGPLWVGLDGLVALADATGERLYTFGSDDPASQATPYDGSSRDVAQYITELGRALASGPARWRGGARALYARDAAGQWSELTRGLTQRVKPLGVTGERVVFGDEAGQLWASSPDGQARSPIEPWETASAYPELPARAAGEAPRVVRVNDEVWALGGAAPVLLGHRVWPGERWAAQRGEVVVMISAQGDPLVFGADGVVRTVRDGILSGLSVREVFVWRDELFALAGNADGSPGAARLLRLADDARWVPHGELPGALTRAYVHMSAAGRVVLVSVVDDHADAFELTDTGVSQLPGVPLALTATRALIAEYDDPQDASSVRCFLHDAAGMHGVDRSMCSWDASAEGERFVTPQRLVDHRTSAQVWTIEPDERVATQRATLPQLAWRAPSGATLAGQTLYLRWWTEEGGEELWAWDEAGGMRQVADLWPGPTDSRPDAMLVHDGALYFIATSPQGRAIWRLDGPDAEPQLVHPPIAGVTPRRLLGVQADGAVWFAAMSPEHGEELWVVEP